LLAVEYNNANYKNGRPEIVGKLRNAATGKIVLA
jgi:hypothetical protein